MTVLRKPLPAITGGLVLVMSLALAGGKQTGPVLAGELSRKADAVIADAGMADRITASFITPRGWPSRHPVLHASDNATTAQRDRIAHAVAAIPGVAGVRWTDSGVVNEGTEVPRNPRHCQDEVAALLDARTIRFEESSAVIDRASGELIGEVADTLRPCLGSIIAITGHTDSSGSEATNMALSRERADAVRDALIARGIPEDGLRSQGYGSTRPIEGLPADDPSNRRIEFQVIAVEPIVPTPIDTPMPR